MKNKQMKSLLVVSMIIASQYTELQCATAKDNYGQLAHNNTCKFKCCPSAYCTTPDGLRGRCVDLHSCSFIRDKLEGDRSEASLKYYEQSRCDGPSEYSVCCESAPRPNHCRLTSHPPDPSTRCCGVNALKTLLTLPGDVVRYNHPWLAIIIYAKDDDYLMLCGGVLISGQYVFTAAHCITGPMLQKGTPEYVQLGSSTCDRDEDPDCNDGVIYVPIQKTTAHPDYCPYTNPKKYDVGLIRMSHIVKFTELIRPVCLPAHDIADEFASGDLPTMLPVILMPDVLKEQSNQDYTFAENPAAAIIGRSGTRHELIGMATMKTTECGEKKLDGTYSTAYAYLDWYKSQINADDEEY